jgi:Fe2+ transport system protein FeoA
MNPFSHDASDASAIQLTELAAGCSAQLHRTDLADDDFALLEALGISRSCRLRVCQVGNPCILQVRDSRIGLAAAVACRLFVIPESTL